MKAAVVLNTNVRINSYNEQTECAVACRRLAAIVSFPGAPLLGLMFLEQRKLTAESKEKGLIASF